MHRATALVLARDEMIAALMSAMVELAGGRPEFARADEHFIEAMRRVRLDTVLLETEVGVERNESRFQVAYHGAAEIGAVLLLFSPSLHARDVAEVARHRGVTAFVVPIAQDDFTRVLSAAATESTARRSASRTKRTGKSPDTSG